MIERKRYVVKAGHSFGAFTQYGPGDVVELTEAEARGFLDLLEPAGDKEPDGLKPQAEPSSPDPVIALGKGKKQTGARKVHAGDDLPGQIKAT